MIASTKAQRAGVLIVDRSKDNRQVLRTALASRGVETLEAKQAAEGIRLAHQHRPRVIVIDLEVISAGQDDVTAELVGQSSGGSSVVFLGTAPGLREALPNGDFVAKPYHYGPLLQRIEQLLSGR